jgi:hypothetical protein
MAWHGMAWHGSRCVIGYHTIIGGIVLGVGQNQQTQTKQTHGNSHKHLVPAEAHVQQKVRQCHDDKDGKAIQQLDTAQRTMQHGH